MAPIWSSQPLKTIYTILFLLKTPPQAAALYLYYLAKPAHPDWNANQSVVRAILKMFFQYSTETQSRHILDDDPEKAKERLANIDPPALNLFSGALAPTAAVKPAGVRGVWLPSPLTSNGTHQDKVILHFPGGAFVITFGHETSGRPVSQLLNKHLKADKLLWAQYRLAADEQTRFPAAVQDSLTYYNFIISSGVDPKNIILSGDSAGGNVVLALMRYLESPDTPQLPLPGGAIVFSPWVKVTSAAAHDFEANHNSKADVLTGPLLQWGADSYLPADSISAGTKIYTSPLDHPFKTSIPLYIHAGGAEAFYEPIKAFADGMEQLDGNRVQFYTEPKGPHDLLLTHPLFGLTEEYCAALDAAHDFLSAGK